ERRWRTWPRMRWSEYHQCLTKRFQLLSDIGSLRRLCFEFRQLLGDFIEFLANRCQLEPQLIQSPREIELFLKIGGRCFDARIHRNRQRLSESFAVNRQRNRVVTRRDPR